MLKIWCPETWKDVLKYHKTTWPGSISLRCLNYALGVYSEFISLIQQPIPDHRVKAKQKQKTKTKTPQQNLIA